MHNNQRVADMAIDVLSGLMSTKSGYQYLRTPLLVVQC